MGRSLAFLAVILVGCSPPGGSTTGPAPFSPPRSEPEQKAVDAGKKLLDSHKLTWGEPEKVELTPDGKAYWLTYRTPEKEIKALGPRVVIVDVKTGEAKLLMRD